MRAYRLTGSMISSDLQIAYAAHQEAGEMDVDHGSNGPPALIPGVKQLIADEEKNQLALGNQESALQCITLHVVARDSVFEPHNSAFRCAAFDSSGAKRLRPRSQTDSAS
jgi:hypothetical protein